MFDERIDYMCLRNHPPSVAAADRLNGVQSTRWKGG